MVSTSTGCLLRVHTSASGAPGIASQATHFQIRLLSRISKMIHLLDVMKEKKLNPERNGTISGAGKRCPVFFLTGGKSRRLSVSPVIPLFTYTVHKHSYSFPPARIERCVSVCFSFFSLSLFLSEAEPLPTSHTHAPARARTHTKQNTHEGRAVDGDGTVGHFEKGDV